MLILIWYLELIYPSYIFLTWKVKCYNGQYQICLGIQRKDSTFLSIQASTECFYYLYKKIVSFRIGLFQTVQKTNEKSKKQDI